MRKRALVAVAGGVIGFFVGWLATYATGWRWWIRICVAIAPAIALLIAERKRVVKTAEETNRPVTLFGRDERGE